MHDIGKMGVPDTILPKPGELTSEEFEICKRHTLIGAGLLDGTDSSLLNTARDIALAHHERWDGTGYPHGLGREGIPASARIVAIADAYDALVHDRVYRRALDENDALELMRSERGQHFDPDLLDRFFDILPACRRIRSQVSGPPVSTPPSAPCFRQAQLPFGALSRQPGPTRPRRRPLPQAP
jgi:putative two-component system response regulator